MQIEERNVGDVKVLDLKGKITLGEGDELLKDKVNSLVNQGNRKIVLNLAEVPYIDSAGLGEIVRTYTTVSRQGGSLKLLTVFETFESENDAIRSFSASARSSCLLMSIPPRLVRAVRTLVRWRTAPHPLWRSPAQR